MDICPATIINADSNALFHAESWRSAYRGIFRDAFLNGEVVQDRKTNWQQRFTHSKTNQLVLVAEAANKILVFIGVFGNEDPKWGTVIDNLHVHISRKRQGIGRRLVTRIALWSRQYHPGAVSYFNEL